jgi:hypothetical protein
MATLIEKDKRTVQFAVSRLFSDKSIFVPTSISDFRSIPPHHHFSRTINLTNDRTVFLTDSGHKHFCSVVDVMERSKHFSGLADRSDIWSAWHKVVGSWISNNLIPEHAEEVVQAIDELVTQEIDDYTFLVPLFGIELEDIDSFPIGSMTILRMPIEAFDSAKVTHDHVDLPDLLNIYKDCLWLKGTSRGTPQVAQQNFSEQAISTVGMLAIAAAALYERGANSFRIGVVMTPEDANGRSVWFSWGEKTRTLTTHYKFPKGQPFPINTALSDEADIARMLYRGFSILQTNNRTQLEEAIAKAVYWYSDAQRDSVMVMRLVKYWSCVEAFFSFEKEEITHAVSTGLSSILVFGGFRFVPPSEYNVLKNKISNLYSLRSRAVHRGAHQHITEQEVAQFSQWVAWLIISMVALVELGYTKLHEVRTQTERLDAIAKRSKETGSK